jgi:hypothetical protein
MTTQGKATQPIYFADWIFTSDSAGASGIADLLLFALRVAA